VGFGDCLLLSVTYGSALADGRRQRHVLIDCGTSAPAAGGPSLAAVAGRIAEHCEGRLDVVVATSRHPEHVGGFADPDARRILAPLRPDVVVRPWTEAPGRDDLDARSQQFLSLLDGVQARSASVLDDWAQLTRYVAGGSTIRLDEQLPGVTVEVLGPPGGDQVGALLAPARNGAEAWLQLSAEDRLAPLLEQPAADSWDDALRVLAPPGRAGAAEQLVRTLRAQHQSPTMDMAEAFGDVVHDTSVVLLVTVGSRSLLLPGDAQDAGWSPALDRAAGVGGPRDAELARRLAGVDVYKVGGHGTRAGTPLGLSRLWRRRVGSGHPLVSVLSTEQTALVPDDSLLAGLTDLGPVHRTDQLPDGVQWLDVEAPARGKEPVAVTPGPRT